MKATYVIIIGQTMSHNWTNVWPNQNSDINQLKRSCIRHTLYKIGFIFDFTCAIETTLKFSFVYHLFIPEITYTLGRPSPLLVWAFYFQNIFRVFLEHFHTTDKISILWNCTKLRKLDFSTILYDISKIFPTIEEFHANFFSDTLLLRFTINRSYFLLEIKLRKKLVHYSGLGPRGIV